MSKSWENLYLPAVVAGLSKVISTGVRSHEPIRNNSLWERAKRDEQKRRLLISAVIEELSNDSSSAMHRLYYSLSSLITPDLPWLIECSSVADSERVKRAFARLTACALDRTDLAAVNAVVDASKTNIVLRSELADLLDPVDLQSEKARELREQYQQSQKLADVLRDDRPLLDPPPAQRVAELLERVEAGEIALWWRICQQLQLEPDSTHYIHGLQSDLTALPGWQAADAPTRQRVIRAAFTFLSERDPELSRWLGRQLRYAPAEAGYKALVLLLREAPGLLTSLPSHAWRHWAPMTLACEKVGCDEEQEMLVTFAYRNAPRDLLATLRLLIAQEGGAKNSGSLFSLCHILHCWDDNLADVLVSELRADEWRPETLECLLRPLLEHRVPEARIFAGSLLSQPISALQADKTRTLIVAKSLILFAEDAGWDIVWPVIEQSDELARAILLSVSDSTRSGNAIFSQLSEDQIATLYMLLLREFPPEDNPQSESFAIASLRNSVHTALVSKCTPEACEALRAVITKFPQHNWLKWSLTELEGRTRATTWNPPSPAVLLKLAENHEKRLVESGEQLLDVIAESLERLQEHLQSETPAARFLWNEGKIISPKDESAISDYVKLHFDRDIRDRGIIANREVGIRSGNGSSIGPRTDIHIDAVAPDGSTAHDAITAIIETKGCWNPELESAMQTQLVNRYMEGSKCRYGIYLVGWFICDKWDNGDYRKKRVNLTNAHETRLALEAQAQQLSDENRKVRVFLLDASLR